MRNWIWYLRDVRNVSIGFYSNFYMKVDMNGGKICDRLDLFWMDLTESSSYSGQF